MAPIDSLPPELLALVFSHIPDEDHFLTFRRCALVCTGWRHLAQAALHHSIELYSESQARNWLAAPTRQWYRTQHLKLESNQYDRLKPLLGLKVLRQCPNLVSLFVSDDDADSDGGNEWCQSANALGVTDVEIVYPENFPIDCDPIPQRLRKLVLDLSGSISARTLQNLFESSIDSLRILELGYIYNPDTAEHLASFLASNPLRNVRTLSLRHGSEHIRWPNIISSLPSLVTLCITSEGDDDTAASALFAVSASAPPTLQALAFLNWIPLPVLLKGLLDVVRSLKGLRRLSLPDAAQATLEGPDGLALLEECEERSIAFYRLYGLMTRPTMEAERAGTS